MCTKKAFNSRESISLRLTKNAHPWKKTILLQGVRPDGKWCTISVTGPQAEYLSKQKAGHTVLFHGVEKGTVRVRNPKNNKYYTNKSYIAYSPKAEYAEEQFAVEAQVARTRAYASKLRKAEEEKLVAANAKKYAQLKEAAVAKAKGSVDIGNIRITAELMPA